MNTRRISRAALYALSIAEAAEFVANPTARELELCRLLLEARREFEALKASIDWPVALKRRRGVAHAMPVSI